MTTPNTTPSPTQRVEQLRVEIDALMQEGRHASAFGKMSQGLYQLATELEAAQKDLAKWKGREPEIYQHKETRRRAIITSCEIDGGNDSGEPMDVIDKCIKDIRQQLAAKTRECEELSNHCTKLEQDHVQMDVQLNQLRSENAELKRDKEIQSK